MPATTNFGSLGAGRRESTRKREEKDSGALIYCWLVLGQHDGGVLLVALQQVMRRVALAISHHFGGAVVRSGFGSTWDLFQNSL